MRFVIVGAGSVGLSLAHRLVVNRHDVVLIEKEDQVIERIPPSLDLQVIQGNGAAPEIISRAGLSNADYFVALTDVDEVNISSALMAKLINPRAKRIVRVRNLDLLHSRISPERLSEYFDLVVNPEQAGASYLFELFKVPGAREIVELAGGKIRLLGIEVAENSKVADKRVHTLMELQREFPFLILALIRENKIIVPRGNEKLLAGDSVYVITPPQYTRSLLELMGRKRPIADSVMIWGGSLLCRMLARLIETTGTKIKLILSDIETASEVMDTFADILVLQGDGTDQDLLLQENIQDVDTFIAVTPNEEKNVLAALLAKKLGAKNSMALIANPSYGQLVSAIGVDASVSSQIAATSLIFRHIHSESLISELSFQQRDAMFVEVEATPELPILNMPIEEIQFPHGVLIAAILRSGQVLIPRGRDQVLQGDAVLVFSLRSSLKKLQQILDLDLEIVS